MFLNEAVLDCIYLELGVPRPNIHVSNETNDEQIGDNAVEYSHSLKRRIANETF